MKIKAIRKESQNRSTRRKKQKTKRLNIEILKFMFYNAPEGPSTLTSSARNISLNSLGLSAPSLFTSNRFTMRYNKNKNTQLD